VELLKTKGAKVDQTNNWLHRVAHSGQVGSLTFLLDHEGLDIESRTQENNDTALHVASSMGHIDCIRLLLDRKPSMIQLTNLQGHTPLHLAQSNVEVVRYLIERGADVMCGDITGDTPLHIAAMENEVASIAYLLSCGVDVNILNHDGGTPLHCAADEKQRDATACLIELGADVNIKNKAGLTALGIVLGKEETPTDPPSFSQEIIQLLQSNGAI